jgi:hypothetical protein
MVLEDLIAYFRNKLQTTFARNAIDDDSIIQALAHKHKRPNRIFSFTDIWGALLADVFLKTAQHNGQYLVLADLQQKVLDGDYPLPIFTTVIGETDPHYKWAEMTPFEIGSADLNAWIDSHALGKKFNNGKSTDQNPEESLGYILGTASSVYAASGLDIVTIITKRFNLECCSTTECLEPCCSDKRMERPEINNFTYGLAGSKLNQNKTLTLIDAGFAFNHPIPPLLRRNVRIYIICDVAAEKARLGKDLALAEEYARAHKYPFPPIDYKKIGKCTLNVFADPLDASVPVVIYIPNFEEFSTLKFDYTHEEFDRIIKATESAVTSNVELIQAAIKIALATK